MSKVVDRLTIVALFVLGSVLTASFFAMGWRHMNVVPVVRAQGTPTSAIKTVAVNKTGELDPIEVRQVLEGASQLTASDPSEEDLKWLEPGVVPGGPRREFRSAYKFQAGESWLRDLTLVLMNRTSKNIVRVELDLAFPETGAAGPIAASTVRFGRPPANIAFYATGDPMPPPTEEPILLAPGQAMAFDLVRKEPQLRAAVARIQPFATISLCYIHVGASFDDGMVWTEAGGYARPDPQRLGWFLPPDRAYFPGPLTGAPGE